MSADFHSISWRCALLVWGSKLVYFVSFGPRKRFLDFALKLETFLEEIINKKWSQAHVVLWQIFSLYITH